MIANPENDYYTICYDDLDNMTTNQTTNDKLTNDLITDNQLLHENYQFSPKAFHNKEKSDDMCYDDAETILKGHKQLYTTDEQNLFVNGEQSDDNIPLRSHSLTEYRPPSERYTPELIENYDTNERRTKSFTDVFGDEDPFQDFLHEESMLEQSEINSSAESFEFPGMTIEIDHMTNTINVNTNTPSKLSENTTFNSVNTKAISNPKGKSTSDCRISISSASCSNSSTGSLVMEIERLKNFDLLQPFQNEEPLKRAKSCDDELLDTTQGTITTGYRIRSSTPTGRKSPLDLFRRGKVYEFDEGSGTVKRKKNNKHKKLSDSMQRSASPFMFKLKRSNPVSSKDKLKNRKKSRSLTDMKKDLNNASNDCNESTKLQQPSPFVRTIFQFVESSFDEEYCGISSFKTSQDIDTTPVFTCNGFKVMQESSITNSLTRRKKTKNLTQNPFIKTVNPNSKQSKLMHSGRRVSENSEMVISIVAYLDRIRKAKQKPPIASRRRSRQKRNKSDPGASISQFLKDLEVPSEDESISNERFHIDNQSTKSFSQNTLKPYVPMTLNQRFTRSAEFIFTATSSRPKPPQIEDRYSDPMPHSTSYSNLITNNKEQANSHFSRRTKSLKNLISPLKKKQHRRDEKMVRAESLTSELRNLCMLQDNAFSSDSKLSQKSLSNRNSGVDLVDFLEGAHNYENIQRFPISRTECDSTKIHNIGCHSTRNDLITSQSNELSEQEIIMLHLLSQLEQSGSHSSLYEQLKTKTLNLISRNSDTTSNIDLSSFDSDSLHSSTKSIKSTNSSVNSSQSLLDESEYKMRQTNSENIMRNNSMDYENNFNQDRHTNSKHKLTLCSNEQNGKENKASRKLFKSKRKNKQRRPYSDDIEYWTGSFHGEAVTYNSTENDSNEENNDKSSTQSRLRRGSLLRFSKKKFKANQDDIRMKLDDKESEKKKSPKRTPSWKKKKIPISDGDEGNEMKVTKFSAIRSMFEPLKSPADKKKWKVSGTKVKTQSKDISLTGFSKRKDNESNKLSKTPSPNKGRRIVNLNPKRNALTPPISRVTRSLDNSFQKTSLNDSLEEQQQVLTNEKVTLREPVKRFEVIEQENEDEEFVSASADSERNNLLCEILSCLENKHLYEEKQPIDLHARELTYDENTLTEVGCVQRMIANAESEGESSFDEEDDRVGDEIMIQKLANSNNSEASIIVDVPSHLLPPDLALQKSPKSSPLLRNKSSFKKCNAYSRYHRKPSKESNSSNDSAHLNFTRIFYDGKDENQTEPGRIKNNTQDENILIQGLSSDEEEEIVTVNNDFDIDFSLEPSDEIDYSSIPTIPQPELLKEGKESSDEDVFTDSYKSNINDTMECSSSTKYHYNSYSMMASSLYKDLYGPINQTRFKSPTQNSCLVKNEQELKAKVAPPVKSKPKFGPGVSLKPKTSPQNIALVSPFNKNETHETSDDSSLVGRGTNDNSLKRRKTIALGDKALKRRPSVIWARVKSMEVSLIIEHDYEEPEVIKLESFDVRRVNTHKDVEELAIDTFIKHVQLLDKQALDLQKEDIQYIKLGDHKVPIGSSFDLSFAKIQDGFLPCQLCIKGKESWSLAAMSYDTLIPKSFLEKYVSLILSNQHMMFYGPSGTGKSYIARRLAAFISHRLNEGIIPPLILKDITPEKWKLLLDNLKTEKRELPYVILIDGFSQSFIKHDINLCDLVKTCKQLNPEPHIICTITETPSATIPAPWQLEFRWIWLPNHEEPIDGLLQRYLRRKFVHYGNIHLQRESFRIADWLAEVWHHVNMVIEKFNSTEATIGPSLFYTCPTDILSAEEWFVDLWNYSITPYFLLTVKQGLKLQGQRYDWEDPLEWILTTYPWISEKAKRKMKLRRIRVEDAGYQEKCPILASSLSHSNTEQQRLLEFLRQLELLMLDGELQDLPNFQTSKEKSFESSI